LSYTTFGISEIKLSSNTFTDKMAVTVTVKNIGKVAGKEVVQVYLSAPKKKH
jgi:beta-glucosidase